MSTPKRERYCALFMIVYEIVEISENSIQAKRFFNIILQYA
jgi:hypothetical protein